MLLTACTQPSDPRQQLLKTLDQLEVAIEQRDRPGVNKFLSDDFLAAAKQQQQNLDLLMRYHFRINQRIEVIRQDQTINMQNNRADVSGAVLLLGTSNILPERGRRFSYESRWMLKSGEWKLQRLRWQALAEP